MIARAKAGIGHLLPKSTFARSVSVLVGGTASAQVLMVLAAPLLTRLYSPDDFGLLAVYAGLLAIIGVVSSLRYELAIPLPEDDAEAANVVVLSLLLITGSTLVTLVAVLLFGETITTLLGVPGLASYLWLLPVGVLLGGAYTVFNYWSIRTKRFTIIAGTKLRQALTVIAIQLTAFKLGGIALLFGQVAGQSVGTVGLSVPALKNPGFKQVTLHGIRQATRRYRRFPLYGSWAGLLNTAGGQLAPVAFAAFFGPGAAGLYTLAHRVLMLPMLLIGGAISNVFLPNAAVASREDKLGMLVNTVYDKLVGIALPPAILLMIAGPDSFALIFGDEWQGAGEFARWMAPWLFAQFCISPLSVFIVLERQDLSLSMQAVLFALRVAALFLGYLTGSMYLTVIFFSIASAIGYGLFLYIKLKMAGANLIAAVNAFVRHLTLISLYCLPVASIYYFDLESYLVFLLCALSGGLLVRHYVILAKGTRSN